MDLFLFNLINQFALKWFCLDVLAVFFAEYFQYFLVFCLFLFLAIKFKKYWKMVFQSIVSVILARFVVVEIIRWLWQRPRPFIHNHVNLLVTHNASAFPSGHAAFFFAISTIVYFYNKRAGLLFFLAGFLICLARVFIGIHWPLDILAGAIVGILSGWVIHKIWYMFKTRP